MDWLDIDGLLATHPELDLKRIRKWVQVFAEALEMPDVFDELNKRLANHGVKKTRRRKPRL